MDTRNITNKINEVFFKLKDNIFTGVSSGQALEEECFASLSSKVACRVPRGKQEVLHCCLVAGWPNVFRARTGAEHFCTVTVLKGIVS